MLHDLSKSFYAFNWNLVSTNTVTIVATGLSYHWALFICLKDFHGLNLHILGFDLKRLNIETNYSLKPTKVCFIFIEANSISRSKDFAAINQMTQPVLRVGSQIEFKLWVKGITTQAEAFK